MNKANKVKLGAFVLLSVILLVVGFIATGVTKMFSPKVHAMTVINTSVEGLSAGSPVKYLGLPVGTIKRIAMREDDGYIATFVYDPATQGSTLVLLHADRIEEAPAAVIQMPQRVPQGLHGNWIADV